MHDLWVMAAPYVVMIAACAATGLIGWAAIAIPKSAWYARQPWVVRKAIDVALQLAVKRLQPQAKQLRDSNFGKIQSQDADMLHAAAVQDALETIRKDAPLVARAIPHEILEAKVSQAVPAVVEKVKAKEKKKRAATGGMSPGGRRP